MSSDYREIRLGIYAIAVIAIVSLVLHQGVSVDFGDASIKIGPLTDDIGGIHDETPEEQTAQAAKSVSGSSFPVENTSPHPR
jgi:hypothetical protein